jgi:hypothetical protein
MPPLRNAKHETFCRSLVKNARNGMNQRAAYIAAGYAARGDSADACASRLLSSAKVRHRMHELVTPPTQKARVSLLNVLAELQTTLRDAREDRAHGAVVSALALVTKIHEMVRSEGDGGAFDQAMSAEDVASVLLDQYDGDLPAALATLDEMKELAIAAAGNRAKPVAPASRRPIDEVGLSFKAARPKRKS